MDNNHKAADSTHALRRNILGVLNDKRTCFSRIGAVIGLTLSKTGTSEPYGPVIYINGKGPETTISEGGDCGTDCKIVMNTDMFMKISTGYSDIRYAIIEGTAIKIEGPESVAIAFGDILRGDEIQYPEPAAALEGRLPKATSDLIQVKKDLEEWGYAFVSNALTPEETAALRHRTLEQAIGERERGFAIRDGGPTRPNQRIFNLLSKGQEYIDLLKNPLVGLVHEVLGHGIQLHSYTVNIAQPGSLPMVIHTDQMMLQPPIRQFPIGLNIMWFLTEVTESNGGTRVFPGSHKPGCAPKDLHDVSQSVFASGPPGTAMIFESRLWHATGANTEESGARPVVISFFCPGFHPNTR